MTSKPSVFKGCGCVCLQSDTAAPFLNGSLRRRRGRAGGVGLEEASRSWRWRSGRLSQQTAQWQLRRAQVVVEESGRRARWMWCVEGKEQTRRGSTSAEAGAVAHVCLWAGPATTHEAAQAGNAGRTATAKACRPAMEAAEDGGGEEGQGLGRWACATGWLNGRLWRGVGGRTSEQTGWLTD
jgi:hypothetical protein